MDNHDNSELAFAIKSLNQKVQNLSTDVFIFDSHIQVLTEEVKNINNEIRKMKVENEKRKGWFW